MSSSAPKQTGLRSNVVLISQVDNRIRYGLSTALDLNIIKTGTTIVAVTYEGGVLMGGDRRATMGNLISSRDIEKVYPADSYSVIGIAGAAGIAIEMVKLYQVEL